MSMLSEIFNFKKIIKTEQLEGLILNKTDLPLFTKIRKKTFERVP